MAANQIRVINTSTIGKQMDRACLASFAPNLIHLVGKVRNDPGLIDLGHARCRRKLPSLWARANHCKRGWFSAKPRRDSRLVLEGVVAHSGLSVRLDLGTGQGTRTSRIVNYPGDMSLNKGKIPVEPEQKFPHGLEVGFAPLKLLRDGVEIPEPPFERVGGEYGP